MKFSKEEITNIQKTLYKNLKKRAISYEGPPSKELLAYRIAQRKISNRDFSVSNSEELFKKIGASDIIYLGDIHTLDQNSKNLERIFRFLKSSNEKFAFGLEFVLRSQQQKIDNYLKNHITEFEFLDSINYEKSWKFPWKHYKKIFYFSKKYKIPILGLNSQGTLKERDLEAAKLIANFKKNNPSYKILVLFGELHIIPSKIPMIVSSLYSDSLDHLIIHQNLDDIFWKIKTLDHSIIKFNENEYSLQVSPPWIKYESMINWWENIINDPEYDLHEYILERGVESLSSEAGEKLLFFAKTINNTLELGIKIEELANFNILSLKNLKTLLSKIKKFKNPEFEKFLKELITNGIFFKLPFSFDYYCPNYSSNKLAGISGVHLRSILINNYFPEKSKTDTFLHFLGNFLASYISVKVFNPYKKCDLYCEIEEKCNSKNLPLIEKNVFVFSKLILDKLFTNSLEKYIFESKDLLELYFSSRIIGYFFAEVFHQQMETFSEEDKHFITSITFKKALQFDDLQVLYKVLFNKKDLKKFKKRYF